MIGNRKNIERHHYSSNDSTSSLEQESHSGTLDCVHISEINKEDVLHHEQPIIFNGIDLIKYFDNLVNQLSRSISELHAFQELHPSYNFTADALNHDDLLQQECRVIWNHIKYWKLLVIMLRMDLVASGIELACNEKFKTSLLQTFVTEVPDIPMPHSVLLDHSQQDVTCPTNDLFATSEYISSLHIDILQYLSKGEKVRYLFLKNRSFRMILALIEWCEWIARVRKACDSHLDNSQSNNYLHHLKQFSYNTTQRIHSKTQHVNGNIRCHDTLFRLNQQKGITYGSDHTTQSIRPYHLDMQFTLKGNTSVVADSTITEKQCLLGQRKRSVTRFHDISPVDSLCSNKLFESIWSLLIIGKVNQINETVTLLGEPWLETILAGQIPFIDPDITSTMLYDQSFNGLSQSILQRIQKEQQLSHSIDQLDIEHHEDCDVLFSSSWTYSLLFDSSNEIIRTSKNQLEAEEFHVGNEWTQLFQNVTSYALKSSIAESLPSYEKSFYGYLSGSFDAMKISCVKWEELLWANCIELQERLLNCLTHTKAENNDRSFLNLKSYTSIEDYSKEFQHIFHTIDIHLQTSQDDCVWKRLTQCLILSSFDPMYFFDVINILQPHTTTHFKTTQPVISNQAHSSDLIIFNQLKVSRFLMQFIVQFKTYMIHQFHDLEDKNSLCQLCDNSLCQFLLKSNISSHQTCHHDISDSLSILKELSEPLQIMTTAQWLCTFPNNKFSLEQSSSFIHYAQYIIESVYETFTQTFLMIIQHYAMILWDRLHPCIHSDSPLSFETLSQIQFFILCLSLSSQYIVLSQIKSKKSFRQESENPHDSDTLATETDISVNDFTSEVDINTYILRLMTPLLAIYCYSELKYGSLLYDATSYLHSVKETYPTTILSNPSTHYSPSLDCKQLKKDIFLSDPMSDFQMKQKPNNITISPSYHINTINETHCHAVPNDINLIKKNSFPNQQWNEGQESIHDQQLSDLFEIIDNYLVRDTFLFIQDRVTQYTTTPPLEELNDVTSNQQQEEQTKTQTASYSNGNQISVTTQSHAPLNFCEILAKSRAPQDLAPLIVISNTSPLFWETLQLPNSSMILSLTPFVHYLGLRHFTEIIMTLKDFKVILLDSIFRAACHRIIDYQEIDVLCNRLTIGFQTKFSNSPYIIALYRSSNHQHLSGNEEFFSSNNKTMSFTDISTLDEILVKLLFKCVSSVCRNIVQVLMSVQISPAVKKSESVNDFDKIIRCTCSIIDTIIASFNSDTIVCSEDTQKEIISELQSIKNSIHHG